MRQNEKTVQEMFKLWFWNFQSSSLQQYSNLFHATVAILDFFNDNDKYKLEMLKLKKLYFHPVIELKEKHGELEVSKNPIDWDIGKLEWCYFRDTHYKSKLSTEYFIDSRKQQEKKRILLGEIITILSLFKQEMFKIIIKILIDNKLEIYISLPSGEKEIEQLRGDDIA